MKVFEEDGVVDYLKKRKLTKSYLKAKGYMEMGYYELVNLRKRAPKKANVLYFKVNRQYRALGYVSENNEFIVTEILDHQ